MGGIARAFGRGVDGTIWFLALPETASRVDAGLLNVEAAVTNVTRGMSNLVQAFMPLFTVGATFLPGLTAGFGSATNSLAEFMLEAERSGALRDFIQGGIDSIRELIDTGAQIGRIFGNIGTVISTAFSSGGGLLGGLGLQTGGMLDTFERLTEQAADFVQTARGSTVVGQIFTVIRNLLSTLFGTFQRLAPVVGRVFGPILPQIARFTSAVVELAGSIVEALEPALAVISDVVGAILPPLSSLIELLARNEPVLQGIAIAIAALLVPAFIAWAAAAIPAAAATLLALAPLILVGVAIAALAALVIVHFDTIKNAIMTAFNWVRDNWPLLLAILTGPIGIAVLLITTHWDTIKRGFTAVKDWISDRIEDIVGFFTGLPGRLADAGSGMFSWIMDGISAAVGWVRDRINDMIRAFNRLPFVEDIGLIGLAGTSKRSGGSRGRGGRQLHSGGIVPGSFGEAVPITAHGSEMVLNPSQQASMFRLLDSGAMGGGVAEAVAAAVAKVIAEMWRISDRDNQAEKERHSDLRQNLWAAVRGIVPPNTFNVGGFGRASGLKLLSSSFVQHFVPGFHSGGVAPGTGDLLALLQGGEEVLSRSDPRNVRNLGSSARPGSGALTGRIVLDVTGTDQGLVEVFRKVIRADFGGDVQVALGQ